MYFLRIFDSKNFNLVITIAEKRYLAGGKEISMNYFSASIRWRTGRIWPLGTFSFLANGVGTIRQRRAPKPNSQPKWICSRLLVSVTITSLRHNHHRHVWISQSVCCLQILAIFLKTFYSLARW